MNGDSKTLTCVYCGIAYPEGTPPHGAKILTDHIKVCSSHPMREAEEKIRILRKAILNLVGVESVDELPALRSILKGMPGNDEDRWLCIEAIDALIKVDKP